MTEEKRTITPEEAARVLEAERIREQQDIEARIAEVLQETGYLLYGVPEYVEDGNGWRTVVSIRLRKNQARQPR